MYKELFRRTIRDIDTIVTEIETNTINAENVPQHVLFNAIPILKKLKDAKKEASTSLLMLK